MKVGDIVRLKSNRSVLGEVKALDDMDMATVLLLDGGTEVKVAMIDLIVENGAVNPHFEDRVVHILGVEYKICFREDKDDAKISTADGYMDHYHKRIVVGIFEYCTNSVRDLTAYTKKVMRHEIVHAFLYESGLWSNSHNAKDWATDEEITDWIAIQAPKLYEAFKEAGCI
jgi:hypothetical protein